MSHLHIPDGVLPLWIILLGWLLTVLLLSAGIRAVRSQDLVRRLPVLGVASALMLIGMTVEIAPIAYHINLSIITGILLGPAMGFLAAFVVNLMLAFFGHGGITVVGLNTLVIGAEIALGYCGYRGFMLLLRRKRPGIAAALATVPALLASTLLMIGIVSAGSTDPFWQTREVAAQPGRLQFWNPFGRRPWAIEIPDGPVARAGELHPSRNSEPRGAAGERSTSIRPFAILMLSLGAIGWPIEAVVNGLIVGYLARVRPDLVKGDAPAPGVQEG